MTKLLCVPGSLRTGAFSKQLARAACQLAEANGTAATCIDLRDYAMPLYDGDLEAADGLPAAAVRLRAVVQQHDALLVVSPEYNASIPAVLKNTLDWLSRPHAPEPGVSVFQGKVAGLLSSSPGALGGLRGLVHLRQILMNLGLLVITEQFALGGAASAFGPDGALLDGRHMAGVQKVLQRLVHTAERLGG
ncbi:MAG: NAD(P)H-dependent oxidoreductase [Planctomycetes bacterium]|nr:NAD(P)H-dependent oxidoreductase [Planctomycetota bacterium]